jgi:NADPH-dependent 2,4-dienoyl-CoA reductase/sulfur reductase-like enzyme/rhodanese-related sulfurtransferase
MKLVIVGGVAAGASAAARARRLDENAEIVLFERGEYISFANCGLPYHIGEVIPKRSSLLVMTPERFRSRANIDVRTRQEVMAIDPARHVVKVRKCGTEDTYEETYDKLILATGSTPIRPKIPGMDDPSVMMLWTLPDMDRIKERLDSGIKKAVVVGGGFLGLELAENLARRKVSVTLVEMLPQVMPPLDPEMASPIVAELEEQGVNVLLNSSVSALNRKGPQRGPDEHPVSVRLGDGRELPADLVVLAIGVRPNSDLAAAAGLVTGARGGIIVDNMLKTSDPDIYAVGDSIQVHDSNGAPAQIPLAGPANRQGRIAADNVFGRKREYARTFGTSAVKVFGITAASTGASEKALKKSGIPYERIYLNPYSHATYYPGARMMHLKLLFSRDGRILGAQIVGRDGVDKRIDVISAAIQAGMSVYDLQDLELAYAPPYGSAKDPVNFAGFVAANVLSGDTDAVHSDAIPEGALVLDVREPAEHEAGAIPGSSLLPLGKIRESLSELPKDRKIVAYCAVGIRGYLAERILKQKGFDAGNLSGGYTTWKLFNPVRKVPPKDTAKASPPSAVHAERSGTTLST